MAGKFYMNVGIPDDLHELLVKRAAADNTDKTKIILESLRKYLTANKNGCKIPPSKKQDWK